MLFLKFSKKNYRNINFAKKMVNKNHAPDEIFLNSPAEALIATKEINPSAIPFAIEKVKGIMTIMINDGTSSVVSDQSSFSIPLSIKIAT